MDQKLSGRAIVRDLFHGGYGLEYIADQTQRVGMAVEYMNGPIKSTMFEVYEEMVEALEDLKATYVN